MMSIKTMFCLVAWASVLAVQANVATTFAEVEAIGDLVQARAAVKAIGDDRVLEEIALKSKNWRLRADAVYFLHDQAAVVKVLSSDKDWRVRVHAVSKVCDSAIVEKYALTDENERVRAAAGRHSRDLSLRARMIAGDKSEFVRWYVAEWGKKENLPAKPRSPYVTVSPVPLVKESPIPEVKPVPVPTLPVAVGK